MYNVDMKGNIDMTTKTNDVKVTRSTQQTSRKQRGVYEKELVKDT